MWHKGELGEQLKRHVSSQNIISKGIAKLKSKYYNDMQCTVASPSPQKCQVQGWFSLLTYSIFSHIMMLL